MALRWEQYLTWCLVATLDQGLVLTKSELRPTERYLVAGRVTKGALCHCMGSLNAERLVRLVNLSAILLAFVVV